MSGRLSSSVILINKIARWQKSPWAPGSSLQEPLLWLISLLRVLPFSPNKSCLNPSWQWFSWLKNISSLILSGSMVGVWWGGGSLGECGALVQSCWLGQYIKYMGEEQSSLMRETEGGKDFLSPQEWHLSMPTSCISLYVLRAEQRQLYFWLSFHGVFFFLLTCFVHSVFLLFILYSVGEIVVDTCVLEFRFILRPTDNVFALERQEGSWAWM